MEQSQEAQEVAHQLPPEVSVQLGAVAHQDDSVLLETLEGHPGGFGYRGLLINSGLAQTIPLGCGGASLRLTPFARHVAIACRELFEREHNDDIPSALERIRHSQTETALPLEAPA